MTLTLLVLLGCKGGKSEADPTSVDAACPDIDDYGYSGAGADAKDAFARAACYRSLLGLNQAGLDVRLDESAQAHADYMASQDTITHQETRSGDDNYTGEWVWDRADAAGYAFTAGMSMAEVVAWGASPSESVDYWVNSVYHRIPFTSPDWRDVGFGQSDLYSSMTVVSDYPNSEDLAVIYPVDGQTEVETTFNSDEEYPDPAPGKNAVGPPITVTVGATQASNSYTNPFDLQLVDATVTGPDGDLTLIELVPDEDDSLINTVALIPDEPLDAGATYEAEITVSWKGGEQTLTATFTTAGD